MSETSCLQLGMFVKGIRTLVFIVETEPLHNIPDESVYQNFPHYTVPKGSLLIHSQPYSKVTTRSTVEC